MASMTRTQFDILEAVATRPGATQRAVQERTGYSLGTVNKVLREAADKGWIAERALTEQGRALLEPYRVKRAIFIAAGFGTRLVPITLNTPKPLIRVGGVRIIDALIDVIDDLSLAVSDLEDELVLVGEQVDAVDEDLDALESYVYDDDDCDCDDCDCCCDDCDEDEFFEVECPACGEVINVDEGILESGSIECPNCGENLEFDIEYEDDEDEE
jgi:hypothetical protein